MIATTVETHFTRIGARLKAHEADRPTQGFGIDILTDARGEFFNLLVPIGERRPEIEVTDARPELRHLLLLVRQEGRKDKFLCGHDERHWFACAVPGTGVSSVRTAMEALKPPAVRRAQHLTGLRERDRLRRRNAAFVRQGEWFFVPAPGLVVAERLVLRGEPISRGRGKPHRLEEAFRTGGETVHVCPQRPSGLFEREYQDLLEAKPYARSWAWRTMVRDAIVFARGRVSHSDHATILLRGWHRVLMNTEHEAPAARSVVFLD